MNQDLFNHDPDADSGQAHDAVLPVALTPGRLAGLVASRLCHDLISPLGAIGNGVELMSMPGTPGHGPELQLVTESVENAQARIRMFRVAFGQAQPDQRLGGPEIAALLADCARGGRLMLDWQVSGDQARREIKMVLLALLCMESALPRGGRVLICRSGDGRGWRLVAEASRTRPDAPLWSLLGPSPEATQALSLDRLAPAHVQFALLPIEAHLAHRRVYWEIDDTGAEISF